MSKLVFIHGRDQQGKDAEKLKKVWIKSLNDGFVIAGIPVSDSDSSIYQIKEDDVAFPFYGDVLDSYTKIYSNYINEYISCLYNNKPMSLKLINTKEEKEFLEKAKNILSNLIESIESMIENENRIYFDNRKEEIKEFLKIYINVEDIGTKNTNQHLLNTKHLNILFEYYGITETFLKWLFNDVSQYLYKTEARDAVNDIVADKIINNEPCVVVGHSLGSVVGYDILKNNPNKRLCQFVTLGSPLGYKFIQNALGKLIAPSLTCGWYNAYDERDIVGRIALDKEIFKYKIENDAGVKNRPSSHSIEGYLRDPKVATKIFESLHNEICDR